MIHWQPGVTLDDVEKQTIQAALQFFHGNRTHTAQSLGIALRTLHNKMDQYGLRTEDGLRMEPANENTPQHPVSVRIEQKVQEVSLPNNATRAKKR